MLHFALKSSNLFKVSILLKWICGSAGIGRQARLRIWWSLRPCGFKSHLPHFLPLSYDIQMTKKARKINDFLAFSLLFDIHINIKKCYHFATRNYSNFNFIICSLSRSFNFSITCRYISLVTLLSE